MEENKSKVTLHGMWASPYSKRIELALKLKGIGFDYVEEDLINKSELLIELNPVHKKVPVLVHDGKIVVESVVILEYIDETWKDSPSFLPEDLYERSQVRFWVQYINNQVIEVMSRVIFESGLAQEEALKESKEIFKILEDGLKNHIPQGDDLGLLDIIIIATFGAYKDYHEASGVEFIDLMNTPTLLDWIERLRDRTVVKEVEFPSDKLVKLIRNHRLKLLRGEVNWY